MGNIEEADLVPTRVNLLDEYPSFAELAAACERCARRQRPPAPRRRGPPPPSGWQPNSAGCMLPEDPHMLTLGEEHLVGFDQTVSWGNVRYSTPDGDQGTKVWCLARWL